MTTKRSAPARSMKKLSKFASSQKAKRNKTEDNMVRNIDYLSDFEEFTQEVLPSIRDDIKCGRSAEEILEKYSAVAAARVATIAVKDPDTGRALAAIKDLLDRVKGRPTEKKEVSHRFDKVQDQELDSMLSTMLGDEEEEAPPLVN